MYVMNIKWVIPDSPTTKHYMPASIGADAKIDMITYSSLDEAMDKCQRYNNGEIEYDEFIKEFIAPTGEAGTEGEDIIDTLVNDYMTKQGSHERPDITEHDFREGCKAMLTELQSKFTLQRK